MTEQELRNLVRSAIARRAAVAVSPGQVVEEGSRTWHRHASHAMFQLSTGADTGGQCVIEPAVPCTHCGYCTSYGH